MTLASNDRLRVFTGDAVTVAFATDFEVSTSAELAVTVKDTSVTPPTYTLKTVTTDYTVSINSSTQIATVTFLVAPASTDKILLCGTTALTQSTDYIENDPFAASTHEGALDKLTKLAQEHDTRLDKMFQVGEDVTTVTDFRLYPTASYLLRWNSGATGIESVNGAALDAATEGSGIDITSGVVSLDIPSLTADASPTTSDYVVTYDVSASGNKKVLLSNLPVPATVAPASAHFVTTQAESGLSAESNLGALTTGILKHTVSAGVSTPATATAGTDYYNPGGTDVAIADGGSGQSTAVLAAHAFIDNQSFSAVTVATDDKMLIQDTSNSSVLSTVTVASVVALASGSGLTRPQVTATVLIFGG